MRIGVPAGVRPGRALDYAVLLLARRRSRHLRHHGRCVNALNYLDDAGWSDWRGIHSNQQPRALSRLKLARMLHPFKIRPRTIWAPGGRQQRGASRGGYNRAQFEAAWASIVHPTHQHTTTHKPSYTQSPAQTKSWSNRGSNFETEISRNNSPRPKTRENNKASSWNRVGDFGLVSRLCLLRSNPSVRSAPSFRPDLHARYADARSGGQGWPAFGPPLQRREASLTAASTTA